MLKLCRVTIVKVLFLVLVYVFNFNLFEFSAVILEKGLLSITKYIVFLLFILRTVSFFVTAHTFYAS